MFSPYKSDYRWMAEVYLESRLEFLRQTQNSDGGWGYFPGKQSWMEPTTYALMALHGTAGCDESSERAWKLIRWWQLPDGGYRPGAAVRQDGTWVTAHAVLLADIHGIHDDRVRNAVNWMLRIRGAECSPATRAASFFHLLKTNLDVSHAGWPWRAGNAAWIEPTAHTLVALKKISKTYPSSELRYRVRDAESMILTRRCRDGGWNCGNPNVLSYDLPSYPETTALALLGLQGRSDRELASPLGVARKMQIETKSTLAKAWLSIMLRNFGDDIPAPSETPDQATPASSDILLNALEALGHPSGNFRLFQTGGLA